MRKKEIRKFLLGFLAGLLLAVLLVVVTRFFRIRIFPSASLADDIYERAQVVESYIDRYYWKDDVSDQTISEYAAKGMVAALGDKY